MLCVLPFCLSFPPCLLPPHLLPVFHLPFLLQTFPSFFLFLPLFSVLFPFLRPQLAKTQQDLQEDDLGSSQPHAGFMRLEQSSHLSASQPPPLQSEGDGKICCLGGLGTGFGNEQLEAPLYLVPGAAVVITLVAPSFRHSGYER